MSGSYNVWLVGLSIGIALLASYTALDLIGRIRAAVGWYARGWVFAGALTMGSGIWSMHFVGMLALALPVDLDYQFELTAISWVLALTGSLVALSMASGDSLTRARLVVGTLGMATAIVCMHYVGMAAMQMQPHIVYDPLWVTISVLIALMASASALNVGFRLKSRERFSRKILAAVLLGFAISGMHYAGMYAAQFPVNSVPAAYHAVDGYWLALLAANTSILMLACMLTAIALDRRLQDRTEEYVQSLRAANLQLHYASRHDPLTNLGNRTLLKEQLDVAIDRAMMQDDAIALVYLDLDDFKSLNDNLGHDYGDKVLCDVGAALDQTLGPGDTAVRIGGDEFLLLIVDEASRSSLEGLCERLLVAVRGAAQGHVRVTASVGVARFPFHGKTPPALMKACDLAMYRAKRAGKDRYAFFTPALSQGLARDFAIQNELTDAIRAGQVRPFYQPKYDVRTHRLVGSEALARWSHPCDGMVSPARFIAVAERSNQIGDLQVAMLRQVCADIRRWRSEGLSVPPVAFNLSALCLRNPALPELIIGTLAEFGLSPGDLICEITETAAIPELKQTLQILRDLRARGVRIALDDFGTGLSSMSYLRDLPVDELKIDRAFIARVGAESDHESMIVHAIINLAHSLGLGVVAEGVEQQVQLDQLLHLNCDHVQGFLFSPAMAPADFASLLATRAAPRSAVTVT
ncbi:bifunctional diguanylate cyclase/phosphodiesterase [Salinisphaera sp. Q1T1-3]|uniref:putative bifunctional diguanylate cyclase/phosphodiesterase n=1 Tax=Salinisphaera sp. Q1T1-3 TaxID=2321229 RepID=UPI001314F8BA|nr:EAL domain-containing protein [Salinisphaera sp. Q1T1-3]